MYCVCVGGLLFELESVEAHEGLYPLTSGFLSLLDALLTVGEVPDVSLGFGYRIPGVTPYLSYVLEVNIFCSHQGQTS